MQTDVRKQRGTFPMPICNSKIGLCLYQECLDQSPTALRCLLKSLTWERVTNADPRAPRSLLLPGPPSVMKMLVPGDVQPGRGVGSKLGASISRAPFLRPRGHSMSRDLLPEVDQPGLSQALPELPSLLDHPHRLSLSRPSPSREVREGSSFRTCSGPSRQRGAPREYP